MPELPEVETVRRGIAPFVEGKVIKNIIIRDHRLRWPIASGLKKQLCGNTVVCVERRGKYLLLMCTCGTLLVHLGMSGQLRVLSKWVAPAKHDHVDIIFAGGQILRYTDPRRFGSILWTTDDPLEHILLVKLGPEPLEPAFNGKYLFDTSRGKKTSIKTFIMDSHVVVGIGNIYANEALFIAGINPFNMASGLDSSSCSRLVATIKKILKTAIRSGGTTLKDFVSAEGKPGYFQQKLYVYGRGGLPCPSCGSPLEESRLGQRSTVYCRQCQH